MTDTPPNGAVFAVGNLLDLIVPFEYPFEGHKLTGRWYKYKTTTRSYINRKKEERLAQLEQWGELQKSIQTLQPNDPRIDSLTAECAALEESIQRTNTSWLIDAIVEWNMVGLDGQVLPITAEGIIDVPIPFLDGLATFLVESRTDKNPTSTDSQSS